MRRMRNSGPEYLASRNHADNFQTHILSNLRKWVSCLFSYWPIYHDVEWIMDGTRGNLIQRTHSFISYEIDMEDFLYLF